MDTPDHTALIDRFGRKVDYIRFSITDRCDFRCTYCMGEEMEFLPREEILTLEECERLVKAFVDLGVHKVRITGGEPLVRKDAIRLFRALGAMPGLRELVMTTNGSQLERWATELKQSGVARLNVSLDSLDADTFRRITRVGELSKVLTGIETARAQGFSGIKLNTVLMKGVNDHEAIPLTQYALDSGMDIAFIEEMPLGQVSHARGSSYVSNDQTLALLQRHFSLVSSTESTGGPARYWRIPGSNSRIGFISPHSHNFCESCNRVRITCKGEMFLCLGQDDKVDLRPLLRDFPDNDAPLRQAIVDALQLKPQGHDFDLKRAEPAVVRFMSMTGG